MFRGGIDYVKVTKIEKKVHNLNIDQIKYWLIPDSNKEFYLIKNFSYKGL